MTMNTMEIRKVKSYGFTLAKFKLFYGDYRKTASHFKEPKCNTDCKTNQHHNYLYKKNGQ